MPAPRVAIVEDEVLIAIHLADLCEEYGANVVGVEYDGQIAAEMLLREKPDYVLMDVRLGEGRDGVSVAMQVQPHLPDSKFIYVTGSTEPSTMTRIQEDHPHAILIKPVAPSEIASTLGLVN